MSSLKVLHSANTKQADASQEGKTAAGSIAFSIASSFFSHCCPKLLNFFFIYQPLLPNKMLPAGCTYD